jgi:hypothetical protein
VPCCISSFFSTWGLNKEKIGEKGVEQWWAGLLQFGICFTAGVQRSKIPLPQGY